MLCWTHNLASAATNSSRASLSLADTPPEYQRLLFMGKELTDSQRLKDCNMKHGAFVLLVMRALGGST